MSKKRSVPVGVVRQDSITATEEALAPIDTPVFATSIPVEENELATEYRSATLKANKLMGQAFRENRNLTPDELMGLCRALGCSVEDAKKEFSRTKRMLELRDIAGTQDERAAAAERVVELQEIAKTKGVELSEQIEALEKQRMSLERDCIAAERRLAQMEHAATELIKSAPLAVKESIDRRRKILGETIKRALLDARSELHHCKIMTEKQPNETPEAYADRLRNSSMYAGDKWFEFDSDIGVYRATPQLQIDLDALREKIPELETQVETLQRQFDAATAAIEQEFAAILETF